MRKSFMLKNQKGQILLMPFWTIESATKRRDTMNTKEVEDCKDNGQEPCLWSIMEQSE